MNFILNHIKKLDWTLISASLGLVLMGLVSIYSSSLHSGNFTNLEKNIVFFAVGMVLMVVFSFFDWKIFRENPYLILILYFFSLVLLLGLYFFAPATRGVRTWYKVGLFSVDPIEITKLSLLILLAKYFSSRHIEMYRIKHVLLSGVYVLIPVALIFFQPNLGSCLVIISLWLGILVISGIKMRHFLFLMLAFMLVFASGWAFFLKDYQKARIMSFFIPYDPLGISWSQNQSKIATGIGGLFGKGIGNGSQTQYGFLSEPQTDFIFAAIAEEMGIAGIAAVLMLFLLVIWRITKIAQGAYDNFSKLFVLGFAVLLIAQVIIHVGMNIGLLPIIGLPLPFLSYGGSNMIATFMILGILQSIKVNPHFELS
jgi:rod shape determining protein RodA